MLTIRPAIAQDAEALCDVCVRSIRAHCIDAYTPEQFAILIGEKRPEIFLEWMGKPESRFLTGLLDGQVVGVSMVHRLGWLGLLYTAPEAGGQGVGKAMLAAAEREAVALGLPVLNTKSTLTARTFYESQGYANLGLDQDGVVGDVVLPAYWMAKLID
jgi:GNAT superfamily N-acetyltransferase